MKAMLIMVLMLAGCSTGRVYVEAGAGWVYKTDKVFETPTAAMRLGFETNDGWIIEAEHISSIPDIEDVGLETVWFNKRIYLY